LTFLILSRSSGWACWLRFLSTIEAGACCFSVWRCTRGATCCCTKTTPTAIFSCLQTGAFGARSPTGIRTLSEGLLHRWRDWSWWSVASFSSGVLHQRPAGTVPGRWARYKWRLSFTRGTFGSRKRKERGMSIEFAMSVEKCEKLATSFNKTVHSPGCITVRFDPYCKILILVRFIEINHINMTVTGRTHSTSARTDVDRPRGGHHQY
jgi:hypothetical protein